MRKVSFIRGVTIRYIKGKEKKEHRYLGSKSYMENKLLRHCLILPPLLDSLSTSPSRWLPAAQTYSLGASVTTEPAGGAVFDGKGSPTTKYRVEQSTPTYPLKTNIGIIDDDRKRNL